MGMSNHTGDRDNRHLDLIDDTDMAHIQAAAVLRAISAQLSSEGHDDVTPAIDAAIGIINLARDKFRQLTRPTEDN